MSMAEHYARFDYSEAFQAVYYERASAASERSLFNITGKSQYERPGPARPDPA